MIKKILAGLSVFVFFFAAYSAPPNRLVTVTGSAMVMQDPLIRMMARPVEGAQILAFGSPSCQPGPIIWPPVPYDTVSTVTDVSGRFTLQLPDSVSEYEIIAKHPLYHEQTIYLNLLTKGSPVVSFEMIQLNDAPKTSVEILVTTAGVPEESAFVSLSGGREMVFCAIYNTAKRTAEPVNYFGMTGADGKMVFDSVSALPFIDYALTVNKSGGGGVIIGVRADSTSMIRINIYGQNTFNIDFPKSSSLGPDRPFLVQNGPGLQVRNYARATHVFFPEGPGSESDIMILDISGRQVAEFHGIKTKSLVWNTQNISNGIYFINVRSLREFYTAPVNVIK